MRVAELWRYPVKSLAGERLAELELVADGVAGDRAWGLLDPADGRILTARREPRLLFASARLVGEAPEITLPGGQVLHGTGPDVDRALAAWLGKPVRLVDAASSSAARAEYFADATDDASQPLEFTMPVGRFVDAAQVLLLTTAGLAAGKAVHPAGDWDVRRFRPNVLIEAPGAAWVEDAWLEHEVELGAASVTPRKRCTRCTMVTRAQPGLARDADIFRAVHRSHDSKAGVWSWVTRTGRVHEGDPVRAQGL